MTSRGVGSVLLFLSLVGCGGDQTAQPVTPRPVEPTTTEVAPTPPPADPPPPGLQLPAGVRPVRYAVDLTLRPTVEAYTGAIDIELAFDQPTSFVWLGASGLTIDEATLDGAAVRVVPGGEEYVGFGFDREVTGGGKLQVRFQGTIPTLDQHGMFRRDLDGRSYLFTHLETRHARRVFPCFDDPAFKVPWQLTLHVPAEDLAFANTPAAEETAEADGMKAVRFEESPPMPSYLVAFAVGPFEIVDAGKVGDTALRVIATAGRSADAAYAVKAIPPVLEALEDYFGMPYPYAKLDSIAVPAFQYAMENPGLVTYGESYLLVKPADDSTGRQRWFESLVAHELAHQWFGDYVTMQWWDDIWLNEGFASWMGDRIVHTLHPDWSWDLGAIQQRDRAMGEDALATARQIRQPIETRDDIENAFDTITYAKGQAVLEMFERYLGAESFQQAVQGYLADHAWGNATTDDFYAAMAAAGGQQVADAMRTFVEQPGAPLVKIDVVCERGGAPQVSLSQTRYRPTGSTAADQTWQVPVCVRHPGGKACTMLTGATGTLELGTERCPAWIHGNAGGAGYYRVAYTAETWQQLIAAKPLTLGERISAFGDGEALVAAGQLSSADVLAGVPVVMKDKKQHRLLVSQAVGVVQALDQFLISDELRPRYRRFIRKLFGKRARALGLVAKKQDDAETRLLRTRLINLVALLGEDPKLIKQAKQLARAWLDDPTKVSADMVPTVLAIAARHGDQAFYDLLRGKLDGLRDGDRRKQLLRAMAGFGDAAIVDQALGMILSEELEYDEAMTVYWGAFADRRSHALVYEWTKREYDAFLARLPPNQRTYPVWAGSVFCDAERRADVESFFAPRHAKLDGGPLLLAQVLEGIDLCIASRARQEASVAEFLKKY
jgi:alanyl aminopeptidase